MQRFLAIPVLAVSVAACSAASDPEASDIVVDPVLVEADEPRAAAAVLRIEDLPSGWEVGQDSSDDEGDGEPVPPGCEIVDEADERGRSAEASSDLFARDATQFSNSVSFYGHETLAQEAFAARFSDDARRCFEDAVREGAEQGMRDAPDLPPGAAEVSVEAGELSVADVGDERRGWSAVMDMRMGPVAVSAYADVVVVRVGRVVIDFMFLSIITPFGEPHETVVGPGVDRVRAALAT